MSGYVCITPETSPNTGCLEWAQAWSLVDLSISDATDILLAVLVCWALAFGFRLLANHLLNRGS